MAKRIVTLVLIIAIILIGVGYFKFRIDSGKQEIGKMLKESAHTGYPCEWSGFGGKISQNAKVIFIACNVIPILNTTKATEQNGLANDIHERVIKPLLNAAPTGEKPTIIAISQVKDDVVLCSEIKKQEITNFWYDSYENYCLE